MLLMEVNGEIVRTCGFRIDSVPTIGQSFAEIEETPFERENRIKELEKRNQRAIKNDN